MVAILAAGCGDDSEESGSTGPGDGESLEISGTPPAQILAGRTYSFTPTVNNPGGVALSFSAINLPSWATLDSSTGEVTGSPGPGDVGTYTSISLTVSGGGDSDTSPVYSIEVVAVAFGSAMLSWIPPDQKTDGSPLNGELAGYRIYYGQSENNLNQSITVDSPGLSSYVIDNLTPATWYFAATAYDVDGMESAFSNIASKTIM